MCRNLFLGLFLGCSSVFGATLTSCIGEDDPIVVKDVVGVGDRVPAFSVTLSDGRVFDSQSNDSTLKIIVFFDTECKDCQQFLPELQVVVDTLRKHNNQWQGVSVQYCAIAREQSTEAVQAYWEEKGFSIPFVAQGNRELYHKFARAVVPRVYVVGRDGRIVMKYDDNPVPTRRDLGYALNAALIDWSDVK